MHQDSEVMEGDREGVKMHLAETAIGVNVV